MSQNAMNNENIIKNNTIVGQMPRMRGKLTMNKKPYLKPGLVIECGSMFSGKSDSIRRKGRRYMFAQQHAVFVKPDLDNRYDEFYVTTHNGDSVPAISVDIHSSLLLVPEIMKADVVLIDEIQFFKEQLIDDIIHLVNAGKRVYGAGLDMDFKGNPFLITSHLMSLADKVKKHHAVCTTCGEDAYISHKKIQNDKLVELGHSDLYEALCRPCYQLKIKK
jgi:thymidine kinase